MEEPDYLQRAETFTHRQQLCGSLVIRLNLTGLGFEKNAGILAPKSAAADMSEAPLGSPSQHIFYLKQTSSPSGFF